MTFRGKARVAMQYTLRSYGSAGGATMSMAAGGGAGGGLSTRARRAFAALGYREYLLFWVGAAFSNVGIWALFAGRLWLMHELTGSAVMLGLVTVSSSGPILLLSMWGGVVADRVNRLRLVTVSRAMFSGIALLTAFLIATDLIEPWHVVATSAATGVLVSFDIPCRQAIVPNLVRREHLLNAIVLYSFLGSSSGVIGPSMFAPLVEAAGLEGLFLFVGVAYALTVAMLLMMKPMPAARTGVEFQPLADLKAGFAYIAKDRRIVSLIAMGVITGVFGASFGTLMPLFAERLSGGGGVQSYGNLLLGSGVGGLAGLVALAVLGDMKRSVALQFVTGVGFGLALVAFSHTTWLPAAIALVGVAGACSSAFGTTNNTLAQSVVDDEYRGRVMSIHQLGWGASAAGGLLMGFLAEAAGAPFALTLGGGVIAGAAAMLTVVLARERAAREAGASWQTSEL